MPILKKVKVKIGDLFELLGANAFPLEEVYSAKEHNLPAIYVQTPTGQTAKVNGYVRKEDIPVTVKTRMGRTLTASKKHIVLDKDLSEVFLKDATHLACTNFPGNTIEFDEILERKNYRKKQVLYDIAIDAPHLYLSADGIVHHNTTLAKAICHELGVDYLMINASMDGNIDTLRTRIKQFVSTVSFSETNSKYKVVILDEADYLTTQTQQALRGFIEEFSNNARFILTCNFKNRIIDPLQSRLANFDFAIPNSEKPKLAAEFFKRLISILDAESVTYDKKVLVELIQKHFPDWRRVLNECQRYSTSGTIDSGILVNFADANVKKLVTYLKEKDFSAMRKWVVENIDIESHVLFRKLYDSSVEVVEPSFIPQLVLILADYSYKSAFVADHELNTVACLTEIMASDIEFK